MKLLFLIGNSAVGKMTVGQELTKITPLRLFHNHMMIEPVLEVFGQFRGDIIQKLRHVIFEEFAKTDNYGLVFTFMWAFDMPSDWEYLERVKQIFNLPEEDVYYVELIAPQEVRLQRNCTENRLKNKASFLLCLSEDPHQRNSPQPLILSFQMRCLLQYCERHQTGGQPLQIPGR